MTGPRRVRDPRAPAARRRAPAVRDDRAVTRERCASPPRHVADRRPVRPLAARRSAAPAAVPGRVRGLFGEPPSGPRPLGVFRERPASPGVRRPGTADLRLDDDGRVRDCDVPRGDPCWTVGPKGREWRGTGGGEGREGRGGRREGGGGGKRGGGGGRREEIVSHHPIPTIALFRQKNPDPCFGL